MAYSRIGRALIGALFLITAGSAGAVAVTSDFSGSWYDPDLSGQGFNLEILRGNQGKRALVYWYTFDADGNPLWALGVGTTQQNRVMVDMQAAAGPSFGDGFDPDDLVLTDFASIVITFDSCTSGTLEWDGPDIGQGTLDLVRLTTLADARCSGGISDDTGQDDESVEFRVPLENTGVLADISGYMKFEQEPTQSEFKVEVENAPPGIYAVRVAGEVVGEIVVDDSGEGDIEFESPAGDDDPLLDFDPRDALVEVLLDGEVVLAAELIEPDDGGGGNGGGNGNGPPIVPPGQADRFEIEIDLENTGADDDASGEAELESKNNRLTFEVEIEDLPVGSYDLLVGGDLKGQIQVEMLEGGGTEGELKFRDPAQGNQLPLDFDPRGQSIEVSQSGTVFLQAVFPEEPAADDGGEEDDDD